MGCLFSYCFGRGEDRLKPESLAIRKRKTLDDTLSIRVRENRSTFDYGTVELAKSLEPGWQVETSDGKENEQIRTRCGDLFIKWSSWQSDFMLNRSNMDEYPRMRKELDLLFERDMPPFLRTDVVNAAETLAELEKLAESTKINMKHIEATKRLKNNTDNAF